MLECRKRTLRELVEQSHRSFGDAPFVAFTEGVPVRYSELPGLIAPIQEELIKQGISRGERVALLGPNSPAWALTYLAITSMGAVVVPIMPEFSPQEIIQVLDHSGTMVLVASGKQLDRIGNPDLPSLKHRLVLEEIMPGRESLPEQGSALIPAEVGEEDLAAIIYTSGTTGNSKGVMLSHRNILFDAIEGFRIQPVDTDDTFLSILPLAHTYENTLGLILPMLGGAKIYYLDKPPTASVLVPAMKQVRPTCMLSVPLVIEKIYKNSVLATFTRKGFIRFLYALAPFRKLFHLLAGKKLYRTFGGRLVFFGIGGSKLDPVVERFLREARFPFAIGYGLTETAPLIAGGIGREIGFQSTGQIIREVEVRLDDSVGEDNQGEILVKGPNVMMGYYKRPDLTAEVLSQDGWFRTGDLGSFDRKGNLRINGRIKNMIIGANGKNIMPEDIESVINSFRHVVESLVVKQKGKLVALVHLNREEIENRVQEFIADARSTGRDARKSVEEYIDDQLRELREYVNSRVSKFSQLQMIIYHPGPFEKTATQKIKRYLYNQ